MFSPKVFFIFSTLSIILIFSYADYFSLVNYNTDLGMCKVIVNEHHTKRLIFGKKNDRILTTNSIVSTFH